MARSRTYYTMVTREGGDGSPWAPQFGDYDRETVDSEVDYYRGSGEYRAKDVRVVTSGDTQDAINAAIAALNAKGK